MSVSWAEIMSTTGSISFQRGTTDVCGSKKCKFTYCQSWRFEKNSASWLESNHTCAAQVQDLDNLIILKDWLTLTFLPFDLQRLAVPLWKDVDDVFTCLCSRDWQNSKNRFYPLKITQFHLCLCTREFYWFFHDCRWIT